MLVLAFIIIYTNYIVKPEIENASGVNALPGCRFALNVSFFYFNNACASEKKYFAQVIKCIIFPYIKKMLQTFDFIDWTHSDFLPNV